MKKDMVLMDTDIYTDIVDDIQGTASECVFSNELLSKTDVWNDTSVGRKMTEILKSFYKMSDLYRAEAAESLPRSLFTLRDGMMEIDQKTSESLAMEQKNKREVTGNEQKR